LPEKAKNILQTYLRRLTNLSGNNRSLLLLRLHAEQLVDVHDLSFLNNERSFSIINALIAGKEKKLCQVLDSRLEANNEASKKLKKLQRADRFIFEERGSNDLHVGWPFLRGKFSDGTVVRCPLLFFPVALEQENNQWILRPRTDAGVTLNKSFLLAYAFYNKVSIQEDLLETNFEDFSADSTVFRTEIYQLLKDKIEINFNSDNFRDELIKFQEFKKEEYESATRNGELKLYPEAVLGIFPQAGSQLVPDYLQLLEESTVSDLEEFFTQKDPKDQHNNPVTKEEKLFTPFVLDAYQENAIKKIKHGESIVVQGPPGTGKSQLICNLIADGIAAGKRILLVCQKRAALDVVYNRLTEIDLADFLGLVHDYRNDRREIFSKIARQIDKIDEYKARNRSIDSIQLERRFFQVCRKIDQLIEEFEEYRQTLFDEKECGVAVKELYLTSDIGGSGINIKQEYQYFKFDDLNEFITKLKAYSNYAAWFEEDEYLWRERKSFANLRLSDLKAIENVIKDVPRYQASVISEVEKLIHRKLTVENIETLHARESDILGLMAVLTDEETYHYFQAMVHEEEDETSLLWFTNTERVSLNCFEGAGPEVTVPSAKLGHVQLALETRMNARRNVIGRIGWEFSKNKVLLKKILANNDLEYNKVGMQTLEERIDCRLNLEHHLTALRNKTWLKNIPSSYKREILRGWFGKQKLAIRGKLIFNTLEEIKDAIAVETLSRAEFIQLLRQIIGAVQDVSAKRAEWLHYLSPYQIRQLSAEPSLEHAFIKAVRKDFDNLCEFDKLKEELLEHEKHVISKLRDEVGSWETGRIVSCFQNSIRLAWIDHIETKYPILRIVSSIRMEDNQAELQQLVAEKQKLSDEILQLRAREHVVENIEYNRLNNRVTYRDLQHQATKKKKIWPLRKVVTEFQDELFKLVPCWMASPESVSAIFPMKELFDLVIFDEASQCFAERGIPAMYRGKQLLVAGDSKQLRPNELYQVRWEEGDHPDEEVDSLLELSERYLSTVHLQGHYRSRSLELIDFSNRHFYEGRLRLLPDKNLINNGQPAIEYCKVDGVWEDQTNVAEAAMIVDRVKALLDQSPEKEIGIVTFNAPQQVLILDLLEEDFAKAGRIIPTSLFVKNIENVQGDEKDIIIFSIGYAPDKKNKMNMQFGTLNMTGGENRLNVAVTRAREKVILVTSIWPEQLKTEASKNEGPRLLREYLQYAREVSQRNFKSNVTNGLDKHADWYLSAAIKRWSEKKFQNIHVESDVLPFSDLSFKSDSHYLGVVLTDDSRYYTSLSSKDNHAYTPSLIAGKNWGYRMIFSRNYWQNRERVEDMLTSFIGTSREI